AVKSQNVRAPPPPPEPLATARVRPSGLKATPQVSSGLAAAAGAGPVRRSHQDSATPPGVNPSRRATRPAVRSGCAHRRAPDRAGALPPASGRVGLSSGFMAAPPSLAVPPGKPREGPGAGPRGGSLPQGRATPYYYSPGRGRATKTSAHPPQRHGLRREHAL